jgi:hypothetical protein
MRKKRLGKDEKREVTPEFVNMSKEILYPQIQGVTGLIEGKSTSVTYEQIQVNVNNTGLLFIYL